jgi:hypothetical protein
MPCGSRVLRSSVDDMERVVPLERPTVRAIDSRIVLWMGFRRVRTLIFEGFEGLFLATRRIGPSFFLPLLLLARIHDDWSWPV